MHCVSCARQPSPRCSSSSAHRTHRARTRFGDASGTRTVSPFLSRRFTCHQVTVSDRNGEFVLGSLQTRDYELTIRRIGYQPTQLKVHVPSDEGWIPITMTSIPRLLDSVRIRERGSLRYTALSPQCIHGSRSRGVRVSPEGLDRNTRVTDAGLVRARS